MSEIAFPVGTKSVLLRSVTNVCTKLLASMWLALTAAAMAAGPATNSTTSPQPERWLLVVDTSASMARRAQAMEGVLGELLSSGIYGQMQPGDELGIWTYNKELFAGTAPMQIWDPARSNIISGRSSRFVGRQKFENQARIDTVIPELNRLAKGSRRLTVLLFSDGAQNISGTPFDDAINAACAERQADLARTRMPLVTVLRSERGIFIGYNVSSAPWPIEFPAFQPEPVEAEKPTPPPKPMKSIIIGGGPKETVPATNSFSISNTANANASLPVAEVQSVPMASVEPTPTVEPVLPKPLPETNAVSPSQPVAVTMAEPPQPEPFEVQPPVPSVPAAVAPAPIPAVETGRPGTFSKQKWLLILGMGCMWVAIVIALVLVRRSRRSNTPSLITRSFDRNQR